MNKITQNAASAFMSSTPFKMSNTEIVVLPNVTIMRLFDNPIAYRYNDPKNTLSITNAGWNTTVTKERLNGLDGVNINQKKGVWYLNGQEWNGAFTKI